MDELNYTENKLQQESGHTVYWIRIEMMEYFYVRATEMHFRNTHLFCSENGENEHVEQKKCKHNFCIPIVRNFPLQLTIRLSIETFSDARYSSLCLSLWEFLYTFQSLKSQFAIKLQWNPQYTTVKCLSSG